MQNIEELVKKYSDDNKLTCAKAFAIAKKANVKPIEVGKVADKLGIRITDCGLGQFGKLDFTDNYEKEIVTKLKNLADDKNRVYCKDARALKYNLKKVRSAIKDNNFDVIYCELGVFKEKKQPKTFIKTKIWIEDKKGNLLFEKEKIKILELIEKEGSIEKAAEKMKLNYKKVLDYIKILQQNLKDELVIVEKESTKLTKKAKEYIQVFKELQKEIEEFANQKFKEFYIKKLKGNR